MGQGSPGKTDSAGRRWRLAHDRMAFRCNAYTAGGTQCLNRAYISRSEIHFCGIHWRKYEPMFINMGDEEASARIRNEIRVAADWLVRAEARLADDIVDAAIARRIAALEAEIRMPAHRPVPRQEPLAQFVNDRQNVHTSAAVKQTTDIVNRILEIEVPKMFRWNMTRCSKTPGEIIADCRLSINSSRTMMDKYTSADEIYGLGRGIYGRLLDAVWQYIKKSEDRKTLRRILASELEDNIGMCQQGNLSRLANVLAGYLTGVGSCESIADVLGREFPKLWDIDDEDERIAEGNKILDRLVVTDADTRKAWIDGLY